MLWTRILPTQPGYYFYRSSSFAGEKIIEFQRDGFFRRDGIRFSPKEGDQFCGPIKSHDVLAHKAGIAAVKEVDGSKQYMLG